MTSYNSTSTYTGPRTGSHQATSSIVFSFIQQGYINPLNAELNPICHLLALLGAHHILHVSRIRVKSSCVRLSKSKVLQKLCRGYTIKKIYSLTSSVFYFMLIGEKNVMSTQNPEFWISSSSLIVQARR
jgi:hypothetical protein